MSTIPKMIEPLRTLLLMGARKAGCYRAANVVDPVQEMMSNEELRAAKEFLDWIVKHDLSFGHGTIDLRYHEFKNNLPPCSKEEAYDYAMKQAGI